MESQIFISHSHDDANIAEALVDALLAAMDISPDSVRCTSVPGHQLPFGRTIAEQLKVDIGATSAVLVLLTQNSLRSKWVLFELGATWALGKVVIPILGHGMAVSDLPGPLANYPSVAIDSPDATNRIADAMAQIASTLKISQRFGGKREAKVRKFLDCAQSSSPSTATNASIDQAMAFEIPWLILVVVGGGARYPEAVFAQIETYLSKLGIPLAKPLSEAVWEGDDGREAMKLLAAFGGELAAKRPDLAAYYEAGANLLPLAVHGNVEGISRAVQRIALPMEVAALRDDLRDWADAIHRHMAKPLGLN
jgi:TIR domain